MYGMAVVLDLDVLPCVLGQALQIHGPGAGCLARDKGTVHWTRDLLQALAVAAENSRMAEVK